MSFDFFKKTLMKLSRTCQIFEKIFSLYELWKICLSLSLLFLPPLLLPLKSFNPWELEKFSYSNWKIAKTFSFLSFQVLIARTLFETYLRKTLCKRKTKKLIIISIFLKWNTNFRDIISDKLFKATIAIFA